MAGCGRVSRAAATAATLGCVVALGTGCGSGGPATAAQPSASTAPTASAPTSTLTETAGGGLATGSERRALAARYLAIARAGNRGLDRSLDPLGDRDKSRLGPARADLRAAANVERTFDRRLLRIPFPAETERAARMLYHVNQARASLTDAAARSTSVSELHAYERRLGEANKPVEAAVRTIRGQLGLPAPPSS